MKVRVIKANSIEEAIEQIMKETKKEEVHVKARYGKTDQQQADLKVIMKMLGEIKVADSREEVMAKAGIACGYANAMQMHNLISEEEMQQINDMISEIGEVQLKKVSKIEHRIFARYLRKKVAV